jgi:glycerol-3-phosphate dehydrogenase
MLMQRNFIELSAHNFDLLVCGGGIYGAWTAYDAALRGLKVAIVDKGDWASGTSSASSKLIHGGLRYLETLDFGLVKKTLVERQMFLDSSPHRVWPLRFGVPVFRESRLNRFQLKAGLMLYDWLAACKDKAQKHRYFSKTAFIDNFPQIQPNELLGGFSYLDAQTDDARFVLELIDGTQQLGGICVNYAQVIGFREQDGRITSAQVRDVLTGDVIDVNAIQFVDTTGRWTDDMQRQPKQVSLSKGVHLILPKTLQNEALLLTAKSDGRVFFMIPWYELTLIGTTDTNYVGDLDNLTITPDEIDYLLTEANHVLQSVSWTKSDILGKFVGVRVLQEHNATNPSRISRDWSLTTAANGLISSIGGKLTSAREDAAVIVDKVCRNLARNKPCQTFGKPLPWLSNEDYNSLKADIVTDAAQLNISCNTSTWLLRRYGENTRHILAICRKQPNLSKPIYRHLPFIQGELLYCAENEMVVHLDDLIRRRIPLLITTPIQKQEISEIANLCGTVLAWDSIRITSEIERCLNLIEWYSSQ